MARYNIAKAKAKYRDRRRKLQPGSGRDRILDIAPDFDGTPDDFAEYL